MQQEFTGGHVISLYSQVQRTEEALGFGQNRGPPAQQYVGNLDVSVSTGTMQWSKFVLIVHVWVEVINIIEGIIRYFNELLVGIYLKL